MDNQNYFTKVDESAAWLRGKVKLSPEVIVVLSGGLSAFLGSISDRIEIESSTIPHFPVSHAEGHSGRVVFGKHGALSVVVMEGRAHCYEGHSPQSVVFPYFVFSKLGAKTLITTNAVGAVNATYKAGDIMIVDDHINMMGVNPLIGIAMQRKTDQFTSMCEAYDEALKEAAERVAADQNIDLKRGVYIAISGPSYETKSEIRLFRQMGADAVGMSTVPEVIAANFLKLKVLSLSCIANMAADLHGGNISHSEVLSAMKALAPKVVALLGGIVDEIKRI